MNFEHLLIHVVLGLLNREGQKIMAEQAPVCPQSLLQLKAQWSCQG